MKCLQNSFSIFAGLTSSDNNRLHCLALAGPGANTVGQLPSQTYVAPLSYKCAIFCSVSK